MMLLSSFLFCSFNNFNFLATIFFITNPSIFMIIRLLEKPIRCAELQLSSRLHTNPPPSRCMAVPWLLSAWGKGQRPGNAWLLFLGPRIKVRFRMVVPGETNDIAELQLPPAFLLLAILVSSPVLPFYALVICSGSYERIFIYIFIFIFLVNRDSFLQDPRTIVQGGP